MLTQKHTIIFKIITNINLLIINCVEYKKKFFFFTDKRLAYQKNKKKKENSTVSSSFQNPKSEIVLRQLELFNRVNLLKLIINTFFFLSHCLNNFV